MASAAVVVEPAEAELSGNRGRYVAFERGGDVWLVDVDGNAPEVNLTQSPAVAERHPSWGLPLDGCDPENGGVPRLPDHRTIVYESDGDIIVAELEGNPPQLEPAELRTNLTSSFAPAAAAPAVGELVFPLVVFTSGPVGDRDLWAMPTNAIEPIRLTEGPLDDANPDWAADGESIVYDTGLPGEPRQLAILDIVYDFQTLTPSADPSGPRLVTSGPQPHADASWLGYRSVDSIEESASRLLYATTVLDQTYLDFLDQDPEASFPEDPPRFEPGAAPKTFELTGDPGGDGAPSWEAEGAAAAFQSDRDEEGNVDIYRVAWDGTDVTRLTRDPAPDLSPDWEAVTGPQGGFCLQPSPRSPSPGRRVRRGLRKKAVAVGVPPPDFEWPIPPTPPVLRLFVRDMHVNVVRVRGQRRVVVTLVTNRAATAQVRLARRGRVAVAQRRSLQTGGNRLVLRLPRWLAAGRYRLRLTVRSGGDKRVLTRAIRLGGAGGVRPTARR